MSTIPQWIHQPDDESGHWVVTSWAPSQQDSLLSCQQHGGIQRCLFGLSGRQAYGLPFCLASIKNIKLKQCTVAKPSHSAITACLWNANPSNIFQIALNLILSLILPQRYHVALSKTFIQTFQTNSSTTSWFSRCSSQGPGVWYGETLQPWNQWLLAWKGKVIVLHPPKD